MLLAFGRALVVRRNPLPRFLVICVVVLSALNAAWAGWTDINVLDNPSFENQAQGLPVYWQGEYHEGNWYPGAHDGMRFYYPGSTNYSMIYQDIDLGAVSPVYGSLDAHRLATGGYAAEFSGWQRSYQETWPSGYDEGRLSLLRYDADGSLKQVEDTGWQSPTSWSQFGKQVRIWAGTTGLRYQFEARRNDIWMGNNDAYLDSASLIIREYAIWTWGTEGLGLHMAEMGDVTIEYDFQLYSAYYPDNGIGMHVSRGATLTTEALANIGTSWEQGAVEMRIDGDGQWICQGLTKVGLRPGAVATVDLNQGTWSSIETVIGSSGQGVVNLHPGVWVSTDKVVLGQNDDGIGTVNIADGRWVVAPGLWTDDPPVVVGERGRGEVLIDGGLWETYAPVYMGLGPGSRGTVNVQAGQWFVHNDIDMTDALGAGRSELVIGLDGVVTLDRARLCVGYGGSVRFEGGRIEGVGAIVDHNGAGLDLGSIELPGQIVGWQYEDGLAVEADIRGSGRLQDLALQGDIDVGHSAGVLVLDNVIVDGTTRVEILGPGTDDRDRIVLGSGTDFTTSVIDIVFVGYQPGASETFDLFDPLPGDDLDAILATASIQAPTGWTLDTTTGTLSVVPEPATISLLALGTVAVMRRRKRRNPLPA